MNIQLISISHAIIFHNSGGSNGELTLSAGAFQKAFSGETH